MTVAVLRIDLGKSRFSVVGINEAGRVFRRASHRTALTHNFGVAIGFDLRSPHLADDQTWLLDAF